jgi:hypothetical protein
MNVNLKHDQKKLVDSFGIENPGLMSENIQRVLSESLTDERGAKVSIIGSHLQDRLSDNEILFLASLWVKDTIAEEAENFVTQIIQQHIDHLKNNN